jgi:hypothetical protein
MSFEAISWALTDADGVPPQCVSVLIGLAHHADKKGRGAYVGQLRLAGYARKGDRQIRKDLAVLLELKIIEPGDQALAAHIPADARPVVYDLAMGRNPGSGRNRSSARKPRASRQGAPPELGELGSDGTVVPGGTGMPGGTTGSRERNSSSYKRKANVHLPTEDAGEPDGRHAIADDLAVKFWDLHKSSTAQPFLGIRGIIRTAIANGLPRDDVARALDKLAREGTAISGGAITTARKQIRNPNGSNGSGWPGHVPFQNPPEGAVY